MENDPFADVFAANKSYVENYALKGLEPIAASGLAVITCMDSRIEPLTMLGLKPGDAKILRNAGARVTDDVLRTLVLAVTLLGVTRVLMVPHTKCKMASAELDELHAVIKDSSGIDTRSLDLRPSKDQLGALRSDIQRIISWPYLPRDLPVAGALFDVDTGSLTPMVGPVTAETGL